MAFDASVGLGGNAKLRPSSSKQIQGTNYVPTNDFEDQFLPETMGQEVERFGPRTMTAILEKFAAKKPFASSEIKWAEQNRLHTLYNNVTLAAASATGVFTVRTQDGARAATAINHNLRVGQTFFAEDGAGNLEKGVITAITATTFSALSYENASWALSPVDHATAANSVISLFVYGSDFGKGTFGMNGSLEADPEIYTVTPIIFKDHYKINGSDTAQIGWIEGITEDGTTGYLWYLKSKSETMLRWKDYLEMGLIEGVSAATGSSALGHTDRLSGTAQDTGARSTNVVGGNGVAGLFEQIEARGHEFDAFFAGTGPSTAAEIATYETDVENIILALEEQAAISDYMWWVNRQVSLNVDKWLATKNGSVTNLNPGHAAAAAVPADAFAKGTMYPGGPSKMSDFGFDGFKWGGYKFTKADWRYLNDPTMRGAIGDVTGLMLPMGTTTVYDMNLGKNAVNPFVYIAYRANEVDNRMNKEWITGSIGVYTDDEDALKCHFLSERALIVQAANNMVILK